jgi:hypothetical protein
MGKSRWLDKTYLHLKEAPLGKVKSIRILGKKNHSGVRIQGVKQNEDYAEPINDCTAIKR